MNILTARSRSRALLGRTTFSSGAFFPRHLQAIQGISDTPKMGSFLEVQISSVSYSVLWLKFKIYLVNAQHGSMLYSALWRTAKDTRWISNSEVCCSLGDTQKVLDKWPIVIYAMFSSLVTDLINVSRDLASCWARLYAFGVPWLCDLTQKYFHFMSTKVGWIINIDM